MKKILLFACLAGLTLNSCSDDFFNQVVDVDQPDYDKQLVIHSFAGTADTALRVLLTRNYGILETVSSDDWAVPNVNLTIRDENTSDVLTFQQSQDVYEKDAYVANVPPAFFQAGHRYHLKAEHPDYPTVESWQTIPGPIQVDSATYRINGGISADGSEVSDLYVYLQDPPGVRNYYEMVAYRVSLRVNVIYDDQGNVIDQDTVVSYSYSEYPVDSDDPNARLGSFGSIVVSDELFDGQAYRMNMQIYRDYYESWDVTYVIRFRHITEEYFRYSVTALRKAETEDIPFIEPVTVFGNLENGIGIFGMYHEQLLPVK